MTEIEQVMIDLYVSAYFSLSSVQALCYAIDGMNLSSRLNLDTQLLRMRDLLVSDSFERKLYLLEQMGKTASLHIKEQTIPPTD